MKVILHCLGVRDRLIKFIYCGRYSAWKRNVDYDDDDDDDDDEESNGDRDEGKDMDDEEQS